MQKHIDVFGNLEGKTPEETEAHIESMRNSSEWGTTLELLAFATMFNVIVCSYHEGKWCVYRPQFVFNEETNERTSKLGFRLQNHVDFSVKAGTNRSANENHLLG